MACIGVICPYKKANVSTNECIRCEGCVAHGAPNEDFPRILRKRFLSQLNPQHPRGKVSVTKIIGCMRKHYFELVSDYYMSIDGFKAVNIGTAIHEYFDRIPAQVLSIPKWLYVPQYKMEWVTPQGNILVGYSDLVGEDEQVLYEFKTTSYGSFKVKDGKASAMDTLQVQIYATMLKHLNNFIPNDIRVVYIGLGDKVCCEYSVPFVDMTDYINNQTDYLYSCISRNSPPKGEPLAAWECKFCYFSDNCPDKISTAEERVIQARISEGDIL